MPLPPPAPFYAFSAFYGLPFGLLFALPPGCGFFFLRLRTFVCLPLLRFTLYFTRLFYGAFNTGCYVAACRVLRYLDRLPTFVDFRSAPFVSWIAVTPCDVTLPFYYLPLRCLSPRTTWFAVPFNTVDLVRLLRFATVGLPHRTARTPFDYLHAVYCDSAVPVDAFAPHLPLPAVPLPFLRLPLPVAFGSLRGYCCCRTALLHTPFTDCGTLPHCRAHGSLLQFVLSPPSARYVTTLR